MRTRGRGGRSEAAIRAPVVAAMLLTAWGVLAAACDQAEPGRFRHQVSIRAFQYHPARLTAGSGDTVVWINEDAVPHTATAGGQAWDTGNIPSKQSEQVVVGSNGEYRYVCAFHPNMSGMLVVE